jgi:hypothetical protein
MNASDIVKAKQSKALYNAYYNPTVFQSTTFSTINTVSSILRYVSSSVEFTSTSYTSTIQTINTYVCNPTFVSYEMANAIRDGSLKPDSNLQWKNDVSTVQYAYKTNYSTFSFNPTVPLPSTFRVTSSFITASDGPVVQSLIDFQQGTNFSNNC